MHQHHPLDHDDDSEGERGGGGAGGDQQEVIEVQILPQVSDRKMEMGKSRKNVR